MNKRVRPIFAKPGGLAAVIRDLKTRYSAIPTVELLDPKAIASLRAKEAHGTSAAYTAHDHRYMAFAYPLLTMLFTLIVLEQCGLSREFLLQSLKKAPFWGHQFSTERYEATKKHLRGVHAHLEGS